MVCHTGLGPQASRQGPRQVCYSHVRALPWTARGRRQPKARARAGARPATWRSRRTLGAAAPLTLTLTLTVTLQQRRRAAAYHAVLCAQPAGAPLRLAHQIGLLLALADGELGNNNPYPPPSPSPLTAHRSPFTL
eukprot:scaffold613_cov79-Phaeocystis_antarctica.AAC.10